MKQNDKKPTIYSTATVARKEESFAVNQVSSSSQAWGADDVVTKTTSFVENIEKRYGFNIQKITKLANLPTTSQEEKKYAEQLSEILEYVEQLEKVDTSNTDPTFSPVDEASPLRKDETQASLSQEEALANAPDQKNGFFVTKGVFREE